jgi:excinuclease ABC subunit C
MIRSPNHAKILAVIKETVPAMAGVYIFKDKEKRTIYIGKSVNLRNRITSYFRQDFKNVETRIGQMIRCIESFNFILTATELRALLTEDYLIKKDLPEYNIRQKQFDEYRYLLLTADRYPAFRLIENTMNNEDEKVFGPYRDRYFVADLLDVIHHYFHIRACQESPPDEKCMNYEIEKCAGPCRGVVSVEEYCALIRRAVNFLDGYDSSIVEDIQGEMMEASSKRLYEKAESLKNKLQFCKRFCARQSFIRKFRSKRLILTEKNIKNFQYIFDKGRWIEDGEQISHRAGMMYNDQQCYEQSAQDPRFVIDRANIIYNWINKKQSECEHHFL